MNNVVMMEIKSQRNIQNLCWDDLLQAYQQQVDTLDELQILVRDLFMEQDKEFEILKILSAEILNRKLAMEAL